MTECWCDEVRGNGDDLGVLMVLGFRSCVLNFHAFSFGILSHTLSHSPVFCLFQVCLGVLDTHGHITVFGSVVLGRLFTEVHGRYPGHDFGVVASFLCFVAYISGIRSPLTRKVD